MARPRRNYTLAPETVEAIERFAHKYFNGNQSAAADHLIQAAMRHARQEATEGLVYAGLGTAVLVVFTLVPWLV